MSNVKKIGILFCGYGTPDYVEKSLIPFMDARSKSLNGKEFIISAVSVPFKEYQSIDRPFDFYSRQFLENRLAANKIDFLVTEPLYIPEHEARTLALKPLLSSKCDIIWLADSDELITEEQIISITNYVDLNPWYTWFNLSLKNYVFNKNTYLEEPFCPPRIFRVSSNSYSMRDLYYDNDFSYEATVNTGHSFEQRTVSYKELPNKLIPSRIAWITHYSWLSDENSRRKVEYQKTRWGNLGCSYSWDYKNGKLELNEEFYVKNNLVKPRVNYHA